MQKTPWIRAWRDFLGDPKMLNLSLAEEGAWWRLLLLTPNDGHLTDPIVQYAPLLRLTPEESETFVQKCVSLGLVRPNGTGYKVAKWKDRQFFSGYSTPRVQRFRKRQAETFQKRSSETEVKRPRPEETREDQRRPDKTIRSGTPPAASAPAKDGFHRPTLEQCWEFATAKGWVAARLIDPPEFFSYWEGRGWSFGTGKPMKDWKATMWNLARRREAERRGP